MAAIQALDETAPRPEHCILADCPVESSTIYVYATRDGLIRMCADILMAAATAPPVTENEKERNLGLDVGLLYHEHSLLFQFLLVDRFRKPPPTAPLPAPVPRWRTLLFDIGCPTGLLFLVFL